MILFKAADLLWATRIKQTADALGLPCRPARTPDMLRDRLADSEVAALLVDLAAEQDALDLVRWLRDQERAGDGGGPGPVRVVAFGPHVRKDLFDQARDAGADEVLTNGALDANLGDVLLSLAGRGA